MKAKSISTFCAFALLAVAALLISKPEAQAGDHCHRQRVVIRNHHHGVAQLNSIHHGHYGHGVLQLNNVHGHAIHKPYGFHYDLANVYVSVGEELIAEAAEERLLRRLEARRAAREALIAEPIAGKPSAQPLQSPSQSEVAPYISPLADSKVQSLFNTRCNRCHSGDSSRMDLTNADALTPPQRASVAVQVDLGLMPKGGQQVGDEDALLLKLWAAGKVDANGRELK